MLDPELLRQARTERDRLLDLQHDVERARSDYHHTIRRLHAAGGSLREIADCLGLSHQRVHQIIDAGAGEPTPRPIPFPPFRRRGRGHGAPRMFERFSPEARSVVVLAQEEAHALKHNYVGTEHLLLGLLRLQGGIATEALGALGVTHEAARAEVVAIVGEGHGPGGGPLPFTPRAKKALEFALRETEARKARQIEPEHLLLVLARSEDTLSRPVLERLGVTPETVQAEIDRRLAA